MRSEYPRVKRTIEIIVVGKEQTAYQLEPDSPDVSENYIRLGDGWRFLVETRADYCEIAHLGTPGTYDYALPQDWYDANRAELQLRGGWAVWYYPPSGSIFGEPRFADEITVEVQHNVASALTAALERERLEAESSAVSAAAAATATT